MRTTPELLEAMKAADHLRASRASSSMHPSWLDDAHLGEVTLGWYLRSSDPFPSHWLDDSPLSQAARPWVETVGDISDGLVRLPPNMRSKLPPA